MGMDINSQVVYGVKISKTATNHFLKWQKDNNFTDYAIIMKMIEEMIKLKDGTGKFGRIVGDYLKIDKRKKINRYIKPYQPFWSNFSDSDLNKMRNGKFEEYVLKHISNKENGCDHSYEKFIFPQLLKNTDYLVAENFIGIEDGKNNYSRDVDWALQSVLKLNPCGGLIQVPGTRPWETGVNKNKNGRWYTHNGENMFPIPYKEIPEEYHELIRSFKGSKSKYIEEKKKAYYTLCSDRKAYYNHSNELWGWSATTYKLVDFIYETICRWVPRIKYDYMKLNKYISFYWS